MLFDPAWIRESSRTEYLSGAVSHSIIGIALIWDKVLLREPETRNIVDKYVQRAGGKFLRVQALWMASVL